MAFLGPLMRAAERGCMQVVQWFVKRGCREMELCLALTAATSSSQVGVAAYLLPHVPKHVPTALSIEILKAAGERSGGSLDGVAFLLQPDFLGDPAATYAVADSISTSDDKAVGICPRALARGSFLGWIKASPRTLHEANEVYKEGGISNLLKGSTIPVEVGIAYMPKTKEAACRSCSNARTWGIRRS